MRSRKNFKHYIRKSHRYLGVFIGVQFLFWTIGGLYFSWTNIEEIRGEHLMKEKKSIDLQQAFISPGIAAKTIKNLYPDLQTSNLRLIEVSDVPFYELKVDSKTRNFILINALNGKTRSEIKESEAKQIATNALISPLRIKETELITVQNVGTHHEYREKPLPAWAVTFENDLTVYLSAENGQIGAFRTNKWRIFDFLWMLHTMDFIGRDNINNYALRAFSILGLLTILSGFLLFFVSSKFFRSIIQKYSLLKKSK